MDFKQKAQKTIQELLEQADQLEANGHPALAKQDRAKATRISKRLIKAGF